MKVNYRERYDKLKELVRENGVEILQDMWLANKLHLPMGSRLSGGENGLRHYVFFWWGKAYPNMLDSGPAKDYACFLLDAFCAHREKHRRQLTRDEGYRIAERASRAWEAQKRARGAIQEVQT